MDVMSLVARLGLDSTSYEQGLKEARGGLTGLGKSLTSTLKLAATVGGAAITAAAGMITALTKSTVSAYSEYEQLVGGVETLFGNGANSLEEFQKTASTSLYKMGQNGEEIKKLQEELQKNGFDVAADGIYGPKTQAAFDAYAKAGGALVKQAFEDTSKAATAVQERAWGAFETAGMSANEYMATVTSFSASLLQSVGGDTMKAAEYADRAIIDMSDNANKMGTSMEAIQYAYNGFAKQNYTMLDNLKLGYGGTKTEMQRLIKDAAKLTGVQKELGVTVDANDMSFGNIVNAISVMQKEMGIAGTTAEEAEKTIEGSTRSMKASWQNLLTAFGRGQDVRKAMKDFTKSAKNVVKNVIPVVKNALTGIGEFVGEIAPVVIQELPGLIRDLLPGLLKAAGSLVSAVVRALPGMLQAVGTSFMGVLDTLKGLDWGAIGQSALTLIAGAWSNLRTWASTLWENAKAGIAGVDWGTVADTVTNAIASGWATLKEWATRLWETAKSGIEAVNWPQVGTTILGRIKTAFLPIAEWFTRRFNAAAEAIQNIQWAELGTTIWGKIQDAFTGVIAWFFHLFDNARNGVETSIGWEALGVSILNLIGAGLKGIGDLLYGLLRGAMLAIKYDIDWHALGDTLATLIWNGLSAIGDLFLGRGEEGYDAINGIDWWRLGWDIVVSILDGMSGLAQGIYDHAANGIKEFLGLEPDYRSAGQKAVDAILNDWDRLPTDARRSALKAAQAFLSPDDTDTWAKISAIVGEDLMSEFKPIPKAVGKVAEQSAAQFGGGRSGGGGAGWHGAGRSAGEEVSNGFVEGFSGAGRAVSNLQKAINALKGKRLTITLDTVLGAHADQLQKVTPNARAMSAGRIFNRPTIFGYAEGAYQMAGDAGPEAVVGVNSLDHMIQTSVSQAMGAVVDRLDQLISKQGTQIVLDTGALVGGIASEMNNELGNIYDRRGGRRA